MIALAGPGDRAPLLELLAAQFEELGIALPAERLVRGVDGALTDPRRGCFLLAREDGVAVGVAYLSFQWSLEHGGKAAWLEELFVRPELRGGGVGRRLLLAACEHARGLGCAAVDLELEAGHERAASLYAREGFRPHRRQRWVRALDGRGD